MTPLSATHGSSQLLEEDLLCRCQHDDAAAWRAFCELFVPRIYRWATLLGLSPSDAEDAAQEVLATAARRIETCESPRALRTWLFQITRRVVANARRGTWLKRMFWRAEPSEPAFDHGTAQDQAEELQVRACLDKLPREVVEVLVLACVEGYTRSEVADALGLPEGTVAGRLRRAKEAFAHRWVVGFEQPLLSEGES